MWFNRKNSKKESEEALQDAEKNLRVVENRQPEVTQVVAALRGFRERNHFADQLTDIMQGGKHRRGVI